MENNKLNIFDGGMNQTTEEFLQILEVPLPELPRIHFRSTEKHAKKKANTKKQN
jgi:hypothetical protein